MLSAPLLTLGTKLKRAGLRLRNHIATWMGHRPRAATATRWIALSMTVGSLFPMAGGVFAALRVELSSSSADPSVYVMGGIAMSAAVLLIALATLECLPR